MNETRITPVETIDKRLKRLHTNEIDGRNRLRLREEKGWEGGKNKGNLEGETTNILKRKHRLKSLRKENKDFAWVGWILDYGLRLRDEKGLGGWEKTTEDWTQKWRGSSRLDEKCTGWKELRANDRKTNCVILKKNLKGKRSNSKHLRQDSLPDRRRDWGVKRIPTLRYN